MWRNVAIWIVIAPGLARAAEARGFNLPSQPLPQAIEAFAVQGQVSAALSATRPCLGRSRQVSGALTPERALRRLLPKGCAFETPEPRTFRIVGPATAPAARPDRPAMDPTTPVVAELLITAEKRREPASGRPFAVSVLTGEEIGRLGGKTFADVALQTPGVTVTNLGSGRNKIFIRGLSDGSFTGWTQSTVGLYFDDVPITYDAPDPDLRLVDIDRIEVLPGPQGTLYGSGSIGGVVKIVTNRPDPLRYSADVTIDGGRTEHGSDSAGYSAMLNIPLLRGRAAVRAVAYSDELGGYIDLPRRRLIDQNRNTRVGGRLAVALDLSPSWTLEAKYVRQTTTASDAQYTQGGLGPLTRDTRIREPHDIDFRETNLTASYAGPAVNLNVSAAYIDHTGLARYDATGSFSPYGLPTTGAGFDDDRQVRLMVSEAVLSSVGGGPRRWLVGLFATRTDETNSAALTFVRNAPTTSVYRRSDHLTEVAAYAEYSYDVTPRLSVTAGVRVRGTWLETAADGFDITPALRDAASGRLADKGFAPKLRVSYALPSDLVVYGQLQEGYRSGGFDVPALPAPAGAPPATIQRYSPDRLWNTEAGVSADFFQDSLRLRASLFHSQWKKIQSDQYLPSGLPMTVNIGDGANTGLEFSLTWRPDDHLRVRANAMVENPQLTRAANVFPATPNTGLPGVPDRMGSVDVRYVWRPWQGVEAEVAGQYAYVGPSFLTFDRGKINAMGDYGVSRVSARLATRRWRLEAYVDNLADARENTFAFGNPFSREVGSQATPLRPRTVGASLGWGF